MQTFVTEATAPTPTLVLALGRLGIEVAADVQRIFLYNDRRRDAVTRFLALIDDGSEGPIIVPVGCASSQESEEPPTRRQACQRFITRAPHLRAALEAALRELHTHERLIEAGLGDVLAPPVDLIVVADLADPWASGALIPLALMLQDLLAHEPYGTGHLLLSTALFVPADHGETAAVQLYATLRELDALAEPEQAVSGRELMEALGLEEIQPLNLRVYLFDSRKEGTREVKDQAELRVILGNFLLALLSGGLAQRLADEVSLPEGIERRAFYSSAAATALVFEPEHLIELCAARLGAELLASELRSAGEANPRLADEWVAEVETKWGDILTWLERICAGVPCRIHAGGEGPLLSWSDGELRLDRLPRETWIEAIVNYDTFFTRMKLPRLREKMKENAKALVQELSLHQRAAIEALPQMARLYPGGLQTARLALQSLAQRLQRRLQTLSAGASPSAEWLEAELQALQQATRDCPNPLAFAFRVILLCILEIYGLMALGRGMGGWLGIGPWLGGALALMASLLTVGLGGLWISRRHHRLIARRDRSLRVLERKHLARLEEATRECLMHAVEELKEQVLAAQRDLEALEATMREAQQLLTDRQRLPEATATLFRPSVIDETMAAWAYHRWRQTPMEMWRPLLETHGLLAGWRELTAEMLADRLLAYGRRAFAPFRALTLEEVLRHRGGGDTEELLMALVREAVPALRPNFDRLGGGGHAYMTRYVLVGAPKNTAFAPILEKTLPDWEVITTGDPYVIACCRIRHLIPLAALPHLMHRGRKAYKRLRAGARKEISVLGLWRGGRVEAEENGEAPVEHVKEDVV